MSDQETVRLAKTYEELRERLLDMSLRNPMLSYKHRPTSKRQLQFVDEVPENIYALLTDGASLEILPLPEPEHIPSDERTEEFIAAFEHAKVADIEHLTKLQAMESTGRDDEFEIAKAERVLRDRIRADLGLPERPNRKTINPVEHARELGVDPSFELQPRAGNYSHSDKKLQTLKWPDTLDATLERIADDARLAEQETGLSTLYLVFGFLEWSEQEGGKKAFAPLLLLPVRLDKRKGPRGKNLFTLAATADLAEANLSLQKRVQRDKERIIPELDATDDGSGSIEDYFARVTQAIDGLQGWQVRRWLTLGHFSFGRFAMYADLDPAKWELHPVQDDLVGAIVRGTEQHVGDISSLLTPPDDYAIDDPEIEKIAPILIHDADASQHSALVDVMREKNLVIQGPPGTGKSQTITNIIANALAANKSVLFLAEKQAALDVVKRRLVTAGIGEFCLELHSDKATPRLVIESLKRRVGAGYGKKAGPAIASDQMLIENRQAITAYLDVLHSPAADGHAPYDAIWGTLRARTKIGPAMQELRSLKLPSTATDSESGFQTASATLSVYAHMAADFAMSYGLPDQSPWTAISFSEDKRPQALTLVEELERLEGNVKDLADVVADAAELGIDSIDALDAAAALEITFPTDVENGELVAELAGLAYYDVKGLITLQRNRRQLELQVQGRRWLEDVWASDGPIIMRLAELLGDSTECSLSPREVYARCTERAAKSKSLLAAIEQLTPALQALGAANLPSGAIQAVTLAAKAASVLDPETRPWFNLFPPAALPSFEEAKREWSEVLGDEARWRARFPGCGTAWPTSDELSAAAAAAAKGAIGRLWGSLTGSSKVLAEVTGRLGVSSGVVISAQDLSGLAQHVAALLVFNANMTHRRLLGTHWRGLETPFEKIGAVQAMRVMALAKISEQPFGQGVCERVVVLDEAPLSALGAAFDEARAALALTTDFTDDLGEASFPAKHSEMRQVRQLASAVLAVDPQRQLARLEVPVAELCAGVKADTARRAVLVDIKNHPLRAAAERLAGSEVEASATAVALSWIEAVWAQVHDDGLRDGLLSVDAAEIRATWAEVAARARRALSQVREKLANIAEEHGVAGFDLSTPDDLVLQIEDLIPRRDELSEFLALRDQRQALVALGLGDYLDAAEKFGVPSSGLVDLFTGLVVQGRAQAARHSNPVFAKASGSHFEARRADFAARDKKKMEADRKRVRDALLQRTAPAGNPGPKKSQLTEVHLLSNEFQKQKRFVPIRDLMNRAGLAVQALTPCLMMSPLSLAKFLPARKLSFDVVVIDEASQMRPEDALGGLLRAKQLVVVGDQKQLPPTDFFARAGDDGVPLTEEDEEEEIVKLDDESILEACGKTFREARLLRWHYRSRCESLINFSNQEFYDGKLITFPMAKPASFSVDLIRVNGSYEARRNQPEAQAIAEEAIMFMRHHAGEPADQVPTLGIVAVNSDQRDLIFEEIRRLEADDALVEQYREKVAERGEPVFVKNLENVQGDERDFILISMTYGPKAGSTAMLQRFGPINGKHGHRRLNVLFSRARCRIGLFTSFGSADVKPQPTSAAGVHILKSYLEYAETRGRAAVKAFGAEPDSDFEVEVADRLRARGYKVDYQVGVSGFRIDLGVRHPDHPERYLAGIECDGARYHSSKSARDRDRLREEVLAGLGWQLARVWSTDWFDNPDLQTDKLAKRLEELRNKAVETRSDYTFVGAASRPAWTPAPIQDIPLGPSQDEPAVTSEPGNAEEKAEPKIASMAVDGGPAADATPTRSFLEGTGPLTSEQVVQALREFRDTVIATEIDPWEPHRSILRDGMIETLVAQRLADPEEWFNKVPTFMRQGTNPAERKRYIERICDIVARLNERPRPAAGGHRPAPAVASTRVRDRQGSLFGAGAPIRV